jgi:serine/threonine-protein kinase
MIWGWWPGARAQRAERRIGAARILASFALVAAAFLARYREPMDAFQQAGASPSPALPAALLAAIFIAACQPPGDRASPAGSSAALSASAPASVSAAPPLESTPVASPSATALAPPSASALASARAPSGPCPADMAAIPGGTFRPLKRARGTETVAPFCIDIVEVTVADYKACVREKKCSPECLSLGTCSAVPTQAEWGEAGESQRSSQFCNGDRDDRQDHPVNCVSWEESATYCKSVGKRLPVPAEWEWAARSANSKSRYPWGIDPATDQPCWSPKAHRHEGTCVVKSSPLDRSAQGVHDLAGNVAEWVNAPDPKERHVRVAFGASWWAMDDGYLGAALGGVEMPSARNETVGFRCASGQNEIP